jgi:hypothetical protein
MRHNFSNNKIRGNYDNTGNSLQQSGVVDLREHYSRRVSPNGWAEIFDGFTVVGGSTPYMYNYKLNCVTNIYETLPAANFPPNVGAQSCDWDSTGTMLGVFGISTPYLALFTRVGSIISAFPSVPAPPGAVNHGRWSPDGMYLAIACSASPYILVYKRNGLTFNKLPNPSILPLGVGNGCAWSPDGQYVSIVTTTAPYLHVYKLTNDVLTIVGGAQISAAIRPAGSSNAVVMTNNLIAVAHNTTPYATTYNYTSTTITKMTGQPNDDVAAYTYAGMPTGAGLSASFGPAIGTGTAYSPTTLAIGYNSAPYFIFYEISAEGQYCVVNENWGLGATDNIGFVSAVNGIEIRKGEHPRDGLDVLAGVSTSGTNPGMDTTKRLKVLPRNLIMYDYRPGYPAKATIPTQKLEGVTYFPKDRYV